MDDVDVTIIGEEVQRDNGAVIEAAFMCAHRYLLVRGGVGDAKGEREVVGER